MEDLKAVISEVRGEISNTLAAKRTAVKLAVSSLRRRLSTVVATLVTSSLVCVKSAAVITDDESSAKHTSIAHPSSPS